jgi:hypothetical protein
VDDEVRFAADLYRGTAGYYDRYRLPYPEAMLADLVRRARVSGHGRLLDLARRRRPDLQVLSDAGFEVAGRHELAVEHRWSVPELAGYIRSTSFLRPWSSPVCFAHDGYAEFFRVPAPEAAPSRNIAAHPQVGGDDLTLGMETFSRRSLAHGGAEWTVKDVQADSGLRLYRPSPPAPGQIVTGGCRWHTETTPGKRPRTIPGSDDH